ncbi:MAG: flagellar hook-length control protein FliK [Deltaproteobacteria bacterium]|nr:flagellar hook-length control protein FliK [Deltaproteobacteria bacterium]
MTSPVASGMKLSLPSNAQTTPDIRIDAVDAPIRAIAPGTTLEVSIHRDPQRGSGVMIEGRFVPARLPDNLAEGQVLTVRAFPGQDALVLKVIDPARLTGEKLIAQTFEQILQTLLPNIELKDIKSGAPFAQEPISAAFLKALFGEAASAKDAPAVSPKLVQIFEKLLSQNSLIADPVLKDPALLSKVHSKLTQSNVLPNIQEATRALEELAQKAPSPVLLRLTSALQEHISTLLKSTDTLDFQSPGTAEKLLSQQLKIYLLASQTAMESGNSQVLKALSQDMGAVRRLENPLGLLLGLLRKVDLPGDTGGSNKALITALRATLGDLQQLKDSGAGEKEIRETLKRSVVRLNDAREPFHAQSKDSAFLQQLQRTLKNIESVSSTQNTLHQMNGVMQALGEPTLVFFPALLQGLFSTWQASFQHSHEAESETSQGRSKGGVRSFERVELMVTLPNLGPLQIDLAHRKGELLLHMTAASTAAGELLQQGSAKLETIFKGLGYANSSVSTVVGAPQAVVPGWYQELSHRSIVA